MSVKLRYIPEQIAIQLNNVNYVNVQRPQGYQKMALSGRKQHSFLYTVSGTLKYSFTEIEQTEILAGSGKLVFIPAGIKHKSTYCDKTNEVYIIRFDISAGKLPKYLMVPALIQSEPAEKIFASIHHDIESGVADNPMYFLYRIYELLYRLSQSADTLPVKYRKLQKALKEIHLFYKENYKVKYYADLCGLSESAFRHLFKSYTGMSPIEYRNQIRLQEARNLIQNGEFSVEEAALDTGFSNLSFFCRSYKALFGRSPGKDRIT